MDYAGPSWRVAADGCTVLEARAAAGPGWAVGDALPPTVQALLATARRHGHASGAHTLLIEGAPQLWALQVQHQADTFVMHAMALPWWPEHERQRHKALQDQRDLLIREVHHRIKNNLQALSGLLGRLAREHPALQDPLQRAVAQVRSWGLVYGLHPHRQAQGRASGLELESLLRAAAASVAELFGARIEIRALPQAQAPLAALEEEGPGAAADWREELWAHLQDPALEPFPRWLLGDSDATAVALVLNELLINAVKHSRPEGATVIVNLRSQADGVQAEILNRGQLPGLGSPDAQGCPESTGVAGRTSQGLGLVQALLPRRGARMELTGHSPWVCARLHFSPPCVWTRSAAPTQSV